MHTLIDHFIIHYSSGIESTNQTALGSNSLFWMDPHWGHADWKTNGLNTACESVSACFHHFTTAHYCKVWWPVSISRKCSAHSVHLIQHRSLIRSPPLSWSCWRLWTVPLDGSGCLAPPPLPLWVGSGGRVEGASLSHATWSSPCCSYERWTSCRGGPMQPAEHEWHANQPIGESNRTGEANEWAGSLAAVWKVLASQFLIRCVNQNNGQFSYNMKYIIQIGGPIPSGICA